MTRTTKAVPMCCVRIGFQSFILPASKGMQLVALMENAFACEELFLRDHAYKVGEQPPVEYRGVKPHQIVPPAVAAPAGTPAIDHSPPRGLFS